MKSIPLFGYGIQSISSLITAQRRVNVLYEIREDGDKKQLVVRGTWGTQLFSDQSAANGAVRGMHNFSAIGLMFCIIGNILFEINPAGNATNRGSITPGTGIVAMEDNGIQLIILDGTHGWIYTPSTHTLAIISDPNFPQGALSVAFDSGFFLVDNTAQNPGQFNKSSSYNGNTWASTDFGLFSSSPNPLVRVYALGGTVILFGTLNTEYWQIVGGAGFPYTPIKGAAAPYGLTARWSVAPVDDTIMFLGQNQQGKVSVFILSGYAPQRISTPDIDEILGTFAIVSDAIAMGYVWEGHVIYQITFPNAGRTFIYDNTTTLWGEMQTGVGATGRHLANLGCGFNNTFYCGDAVVGKLYQFNSQVYTDNGATIPRLLRSRHIFSEYNQLGIDELFIDMEVGVGLQSGQGSTPQVMLKVSKDQGKTFGSERWVSIGKVGQYKDHRAIWRRIGQGRDFIFEWKMTDPVKFFISGGGVVPRLGTDDEHNNPQS